MKVLVGMPFAALLGGGERSLDLAARRAPEHGLDLHVVFLAPGPWADDLRAAGVRVTVLELGRFRDVGAGRDVIRRLRGLVERERPDVAFSWLPRAHVYLGPAARLAGMPLERIAWWQHHVPDGEFLERAATLVPAGAVFCASRAVADAQAHMWPRRRTVLSYLGIPDPTPVPLDEVARVRAELGIPTGRRVVGLPGRLVPWKGTDRFLDAVALLRERGEDVHALVVGGPGHGEEDEWHRALRARAERGALRGAVTFTGHVDDPTPYVQLMEVMVNASEPEPFGLTLVEAQSLGTPVVAVDLGGPREIVKHGQSGWLVPTGSPEHLAEGVATVLRDDVLWDRLAREGLRNYEERFTAAAGVERFAGALRELVGSA